MKKNRSSNLSFLLSFTVETLNIFITFFTEKERGVFKHLVRLWSGSMVWCPSQDVLSVSFSLLPLPQPHWVLVCVEMEGLWPPATCPGWPSRRPGDHTWALSRMDQTSQEILPQVPRQGRHLLWCWGGHVAQCRRLGNRSIFLFFIPCIHTLVNGNIFFFFLAGLQHFLHI